MILFPNLSWEPDRNANKKRKISIPDSGADRPTLAVDRILRLSEGLQRCKGAKNTCEQLCYKGLGVRVQCSRNGDMGTYS